MTNRCGSARWSMTWAHTGRNHACGVLPNAPAGRAHIAPPAQHHGNFALGTGRCDEGQLAVHRSASSGGALALRRRASVHAAYDRCRDQLRSARLVRRHKRTCGTLPHLDSGLVGIEPYCRVVPAVDEHVRADQDTSSAAPPPGRRGAVPVLRVGPPRTTSAKWRRTGSARPRASLPQAAARQCAKRLSRSRPSEQLPARPCACRARHARGVQSCGPFSHLGARRPERWQRQWKGCCSPARGS